MEETAPLDPFDPNLQKLVENSAEAAMYEAETPTRVVGTPRKEVTALNTPRNGTPRKDVIVTGALRNETTPARVTSTPKKDVIASRRETPTKKQIATPVNSQSLIKSVKVRKVAKRPVTPKQPEQQEEEQARKALIDVISKIRDNTEKQRFLDDEKSKLESQIEVIKLEVGTWMDNASEKKVTFQQLSVNRAQKLPPKRFYAADILEIVGKIWGEEIQNRVIDELDKLHTAKYSEEEIRINTNCPLKRKRDQVRAAVAKNKKQSLAL